MNAIPFDYSDFSSAALISIFKLADILKVNPKRAAEIYLEEKVKADSKQQSQPAA